VLDRGRQIRWGATVSSARSTDKGQVGSLARIKLSQSKYQAAHCVIDESCGCATCIGGYSRAYLHHLLAVREPLAASLLSVHNLRVFADLMATLRADILRGAV
jgi:queuine tRNA-ribosyltransferase